MTKRRLTPTRWLPNDNFCIKSECINPVYRVVADICVRVNILFKPNRILDQEPSCAGITVFLDRATVEDEDYRSIVRPLLIFHSTLNYIGYFTVPNQAFTDGTFMNINNIISQIERKE